MDHSDSNSTTPQTIGGVYCIRCAANGRRYIGSTGDLKSRKANHLSTLRRGWHSNALLQHDFLLHGEAAFVFQVLESGLFQVEQRTAMYDRERHWKIVYHTRDPRYGYNVTDEVRAKGSQLTPGWASLIAVVVGVESEVAK